MGVQQMKLDRAKAVTEILTAWIGVCALVVGGGFAAYQYLDKVRADRIKETLSFVERYHKEPIFDARRGIETVWERRGVENSAKVLLGSDEFNAYVLDVIEAEALGSDISLLVDFFEALEVCVQMEICDRRTAIRFLQPDARAFFNQHYAKIDFERRRRNSPSYALGVEGFKWRE